MKTLQTTPTPLRPQFSLSTQKDQRPLHIYITAAKNIKTKSQGVNIASRCTMLDYRNIELIEEVKTGYHLARTYPMRRQTKQGHLKRTPQSQGTRCPPPGLEEVGSKTEQSGKADAGGAHVIGGTLEGGRRR